MSIPCCALLHIILYVFNYTTSHYHAPLLYIPLLYIHTSPPLVLPPDEVHSYPLPETGTVRVTWTVARNSTHGLTLVGYSVQYREEGGVKYQSQQVTEIPSAGELETFELEGLKLGTTYELRVAAVTLSGVGKYSDVINVTTYAGTSFRRVHLSEPSGSRDIYS